MLHRLLVLIQKNRRWNYSEHHGQMSSNRTLFD